MKKKNLQQRLLLTTLTILSMGLVACGLNTRQGSNRLSDETVEENVESVNSEESIENDGSSKLELPAFRSSTGEKILYRDAYTVSYNAENRLPNWVAWCLTRDHTNGTWKRKGIRFQEDQEVSTPRATDADYYNSGYDRGHMCPSGDNQWSEQAQIQSFLFTNCCPQVHGLNAGDWNEIEAQCRRWAKEYGEVYIVSGPIMYKGKHKTIGRNKVVVPDAFFKVVLRMKPSPAAIGFIYKNVSGNRPKSAYVNTVDEVERITGYDFFASLPDKIENKVEAHADLDEWSR